MKKWLIRCQTNCQEAEAKLHWFLLVKLNWRTMKTLMRKLQNEISEIWCKPVFSKIKLQLPAWTSSDKFRQDWAWFQNPSSHTTQISVGNWLNFIVTDPAALPSIGEFYRLFLMRSICFSIFINLVSQNMSLFVENALSKWKIIHEDCIATS